MVFYDFAVVTVVKIACTSDYINPYKNVESPCINFDAVKSLRAEVAQCPKI